MTTSQQAPKVATLAATLAMTAYASSSCSQSPSNYRIDSLTYFDYDASSVTDLPCMYAGNMQSSDTEVQSTYNNFFFWYFPNPDSSDMPLVIYMNGGPGATSMTGLFEANGPLTCKWDDESDNDSFRMIYSPKHSWQFLGD